MRHQAGGVSRTAPLDRGQHGAEWIVDARGNRVTPRNRYRLRRQADSVALLQEGKNEISATS
jgi:hypothetical protein